MSEVSEQADVNQEIVTPVHEATYVPEQEEAPANPAPTPPQEDVQERNWKAARARMDEQARHNQELRAELDALRNQLKAPEADEEQDFTESEKKLYREIKTLKAQVQAKEAKEADYVMDRLKAKFPDFDEVVSPENVTYLKQNNAALAKAISSLADDPYEQGLAAYDALKRTDWYQNRHTMQDKARIEQNAKKPVSVQAVRKQGVLSEANQFAMGSPEHKKALLKEMQEARKKA